MPRALQEQADVAVIGKITGQVTVGLYSMAKDLAMLPSAKISSAVYALSPPINVAVMRRLFFQKVCLTAAIALPASVGVALVADYIVAVLLGPKWLPAIPVLRLLCLYAAVRAIDILLPHPAAAGSDCAGSPEIFGLVLPRAVAGSTDGRDARHPMGRSTGGHRALYSRIFRTDGDHDQGSLGRVGSKVFKAVVRDLADCGRYCRNGRRRTLVARDYFCEADRALA